MIVIDGFYGWLDYQNTLVSEMLKLLITLIFFTSYHFSFGKTRDTKDTVGRGFKSLYIVIFDSQHSVCTENAFIDRDRIDSTEVLPDSSSKGICKLLSVDGVLVYRLKPGTQLLAINDVFSLYKIPLIYRRLTIKIDDLSISFPETTLISQSEIETVKVVEGHFINIYLKGFLGLKNLNGGGPLKIW